MATFGPTGIQAGGDDYYHAEVAVAFNNSATVIFCGNDTFPAVHHYGLRWDNVTIPQGATIDSAVIDFRTTTNSEGSGTLLSKIYCINEDDAAAATSLATCNTDHGLRTSGTDWDFTIIDANDSALQTADFSAEVQAIVDRAGWASGQALLINIGNDGTTGLNYQAVATLEHASYTEPQITIGYTPLAFNGYWGLRVASWFLAGTSGLWLPDTASDLLDMV